MNIIPFPSQFKKAMAAEPEHEPAAPAREMPDAMKRFFAGERITAAEQNEMNGAVQPYVPFRRGRKLRGIDGGLSAKP